MLRFVVFLVLFAAVVYACFWLLDRRKANRAGEGGGGGGWDTGGRPAPRGPVGPDDDEDFLRELDRKHRHRQDQSQDDDPSA